MTFLHARELWMIPKNNETETQLEFHVVSVCVKIVSAKLSQSRESPIFLQNHFYFWH